MSPVLADTLRTDPRLGGTSPHRRLHEFRLPLAHDLPTYSEAMLAWLWIVSCAPTVHWGEDGAVGPSDRSLGPWDPPPSSTGCATGSKQRERSPAATCPTVRRVATAPMQRAGQRGVSIGLLSDEHPLGQSALALEVEDHHRQAHQPGPVVAERVEEAHGCYLRAVLPPAIGTWGAHGLHSRTPPHAPYHSTRPGNRQGRARTMTAA